MIGRPEKESFYVTLNIEDGVPDIGVTGKDEVERLASHLARLNYVEDQGSVAQFDVRAAPSLITRGEAVMLGISGPRFAKRLRLTGPDGSSWGYVHLRRMARFVDEVCRSDLVRHGCFPRDIVRRAKVGRWKTRLAKASCIADGLIGLPKAYSDNGWHVLTVPAVVSRVYGEQLKVDAVPYLKHIDIVGGGMCAQACCFMANMLLYHETSRVYSIPGVSYKASAPKAAGPGAKDELVKLSGLSMPEIVRYFSRSGCGLTTTRQVVAEGGVGRPFRGYWFAFEKAAVAYLNAGMPLIIPVDHGRMAGVRWAGCEELPKNIYAKNKVPGFVDGLRTTAALEQRNHAVVAIGHRATAQGVTLLLQDPAEVPFIELDVKDLHSVSCYCDTKGDARGQKFVPLTMAPVTPAAVKLPLLKMIETDEATGRLRSINGLIDMSMALNISAIIAGDLPRSPLPGGGDSAYSLVQIDSLTRAERELLGENGKFDANALRNELLRLGCSRKHWVWIEKDASALLVWDAEKAPQGEDTSTTVRTFILAIGIHTNDSIKWSGNADNARPPGRGNEGSGIPSQRTFASNGSPKLGLITSFRRGGLPKILEKWPRDVAYCDLYAFLHDDACRELTGYENQSCTKLGMPALLRYSMWRASNLWRRWRAGMKFLPASMARSSSPVPIRRPRLSVRDWLSQHSGRRRYIRKTAESIAELFDDHRVTATSICTFMPGLTIAGSPSRRSQRALRFMLSLAEQLSKTDPEHFKISTIVIAAGTRIQSLRWMRYGDVCDSATARDADRLVSVARCATASEAQDRLLRALRDVLRMGPPGIRLALELEPATFSAVATYNHLDRLARKIDGDEQLRGRVGFNCDVAHWTLAGIEPGMLVNSPILDKIYHSHVSDTGKGHFCDLVPGTVNPRSWFEEWMNMLATSYSLGLRDETSPGTVGLELEFTSKLDDVYSAVTFMRSVIGRKTGNESIG